MKITLLAVAVLLTGCAAQLAQGTPPARSTLAEAVDVGPEADRAPAPVATSEPTFLDRACANSGFAQFGWSNLVAVSSVPLPSMKREVSPASVRPVTAAELARLQPVECGLHSLYERETDDGVRTAALSLRDDIVRLQSRAVLATVSGQPQDAQAFFTRHDAFQARFAAFKARVQATRPGVSWSCEASP